MRWARGTTPRPHLLSRLDAAVTALALENSPRAAAGGLAADLQVIRDAVDRIEQQLAAS